MPNVEHGEAAALRPYQLRDMLGLESLAIAVNQVSYVSFRYPGFDALKARALPMLEESLALLGVPSLNRVIYRYENEVGIQRDDKGALPLDRILRLELPGWCGGPFTKLDLSLQRAFTKGSIAVHARVEDVGGSEVLRVTVAAAIPAEGQSTGTLAAHAEAAHEEASATFEAMITEDFRSYISAGGNNE